MTDPKARQIKCPHGNWNAADCCECKLTSANAKLVAAEAKIAEIEKRCNAAIASWDEERERANREGVLVADLQSRLAAFENAVMPEEPKRYRIETESTEGEFVEAKDYDALRAFAAKRAVDAECFDYLQNIPVKDAQAFFWNYGSRTERKKAIRAAIDAAKGK